MFKTSISATLKNEQFIEVYCNREFCSSKMTSFILYENDCKVADLIPSSISESNSANIYLLPIAGLVFKPGYSYKLYSQNFYFISLDISYLASLKEFEETYRYDGKLGAIYSKEKTDFFLFSPFATRVILIIKRKGEEEEEAFVMKHDFTNGVFSTTIHGDLDEARYFYIADIFSEVKKVVDPYALALDKNSIHAFVVNPERVKAIDTNRNELSPFDGDISKAIIYECNVRDMTSKTKEKDKGLYPAFYRAGLKTDKGNPAGIDYLSSLGITHIQLMPVLDFQSVNDDETESFYNWGYDPQFFFAPEGSYSSDPNSPYCRIFELRNLIANVHKRGMRVVFDVVYNHVYSTRFNSLNVLVPGYYFRKNADGTLCAGSGCGNDIESRNYMARKLIIDSMLHLLDFYDIDGYRFDLMGILDIETILKAKTLIKEKRKDILFYGEGWDLWTNLPWEQKASYFNANKMPGISFFNDRFRDVVKGKSNSSELYVRGYLLGDTNYIDGFKHVMLGSSYPLAFAPMFNDYHQSLNYVECHDNNTLFDKLKIACQGETIDELLKRVKMIDIAILFACGIPFFHAGQELGMSKKGIDNSYNKGDEINGFDYNLLDARKDMYNYFVDAIKLKKKFIQDCKNYYDDLIEHISFENIANGGLKINYDLPSCIYYVIFNPSKDTILYDFGDYTRLIFNTSGDIYSSNFFIKLGIINALSVYIYYREK